MDWANSGHLLQAIYIGICALALVLGINGGQMR